MFRNQAKFGIAFLSVFYNIAFLVQYYVLYGDGRKLKTVRAVDEESLEVLSMSGDVSASGDGSEVYSASSHRYRTAY